MCNMLMGIFILVGVVGSIILLISWVRCINNPVGEGKFDPRDYATKELLRQLRYDSHFQARLERKEEECTTGRLQSYLTDTHETRVKVPLLPGPQKKQE